MHIVGVQDIWTDGEVDGFITPSPHNIYIYWFNELLEGVHNLLS